MGFTFERKYVFGFRIGFHAIYLHYFVFVKNSIEITGDLHFSGEYFIILPDLLTIHT